MKRLIYTQLILFSLMGFCACEDWLLEESPGVTDLEDFYVSDETAVQNLNAAYVPLMWEYNQTYYPEWFIGDVCSDDAVKGGQSVGDMAAVYDMENFKTSANNPLLLEYYRAQYQGVARCNLVLHYVPLMDEEKFKDQKLKRRVIAEAKFLRAMYYFRLVRVFGGVPKIDFIVDSSNKWKQPRATRAEIYAFILQDLTAAEPDLWQKDEYTDTEMGRATRGAAQAMLLKVNLYLHDYDAAKSWGDAIIGDNRYRLTDQYADNFTLAGENGPESVFEIQYMDDPTSDYGEGNGMTRGTFTTILVRSRSSLLGGGWGFNKPSQNLYDAFEGGDPRRDVAILNPTDEQIQTPSQEIYMGTRYVNRKYSLLGSDDKAIPLSHHSRGPLNTKVIRYADVLLMYAEACVETGDLAAAKTALETVRQRARGENTEILPSFPYGSYPDDQSGLRQAVRHERRVELAMEGHRWFDLCRWGIVGQTMRDYIKTESAEMQNERALFIDGKHELFPIPAQEIDLNPGMEQNPNYN